MPRELVVPLTEVLRQLGHEYRHFKQEHHREHDPSGTRRRLRIEMQRLAGHFERVLDNWIPEGDLREAWRQHFYKGVPAPAGPALATAPPLFKGTTEWGSVIEIRPAPDGGYDLLEDGARVVHEAVPWHLDPDLIEPIQIHQFICRERFDASPEAISAFAGYFATPGSGPPRQHARELLEDGLIDPVFALTPRGQRLLRRAVGVRATSAGRRSFCVLVAGGSRARTLTLETSAGDDQPTVEPLIEVAQVTHPERRARDSALVSDNRPGLRREGAPGPRHGVDDRRDHQRHAHDLQFARLMVDEAARVWESYRRCRVIVVASPAFLGLLRPVLARKNGGSGRYELQELARDLTHLTAPALHDALADAGLLPRRGRLPPDRSRRYLRAMS